MSATVMRRVFPGGPGASAIELDVRGSRRRTRWTMTASAILHALLLTWVIFGPKTAATETTITEITLLDPAELAGGSPAPSIAAPAERSAAGAAVENRTSETYRRASRQGDLTPAPVREAAFADRLESRLAALQSERTTPAFGVAAPTTSSALWGTASAAPPRLGAGSGGTAMSLTRGGGSGPGPAIELTRGGSSVGGPATAATGLPVEASEGRAPARGGESTAKRTLAGASLMGPIADRAVLSHRTPAYPEWAKREAVEGSVTLYFVVRPDGSIKENVLVQKTAGFEDFDESARTALRAWRFAPLDGGRTGEQWGTITFHFRLREAG